MRTGTVSYKLEDLKKGVIIPIGFVGENDFTKVFFDAEEIYKKYPNASVSMKVQPPKGGIYPATVTRDGNTVIWQVKEADVANRGGGELQLTFTDGETKIKTYIARTDVKRSLAGNGPAPDPVQDFVDNANEKLAEVEQAIEAAQDAAEEAEKAAEHGPYIGNDGYWYTWNGTEYVKGVKAKGEDGQPGQPGPKGDKGDPGDPGDLIDDEDPAQDKTFSSSKIDQELTDVKTAIQGMETEATKIKNATVTMTPSGTPTETDITTHMQYSTGYINKAGTVVSTDTTYRYTQKIEVNEGEIYKATWPYTRYRYVCAFNGDTAVEAKGEANVTEYTVPESVTHIVITIYADVQDRTAGIIVKETYEYVYENSANALVDAEETARENADAAITEESNKIKDATITTTTEPSGQDVDISSQLTYENGKYVNKSGYVGLDNQYKCTNKIAVEEGEIYKTLNNYSSWRYVCAYNGDTAVEAKGSTEQSYTVPSGITHIIITLYADVPTSSNAVAKQGVTVVYHNSANALVEAEKTARESADEAIEDVTITEKTLEKLIDISADQTYVMGQYINTSGYNGLDANYNRTEKIAVNPGETYKTLYQYSAWRYVCAYNGDTAVEAKGASNVYTYTVPEGITHIVITLYTDLASLNERVIAKATNISVKENSATPKIESSFVKRKARVTFIDDDGYKEFATYMTPIMEEKGVPMCVAYMGDVCPSFKHSMYMTEAECKEVENLGGEIVVHGGTNLIQFPTVAEAEANVLASKNALEAHGFKSDVYVYPESGTNIELREMLAKYFKCAFKTGHPQKNDTRVNDKCVPHFFIHRCSAGGYYDDKSADYGNYDTWTMDYFEALIDDAVTHGGWLVFMTHAWMMPIGSTYRQEHDAGSGIPADLDEFALIGDIIDYILELKQGGTDIDIVTASEGFEIFKNEVQSGDYLGYWNETYTDLTQIARYWHDKAGFAVNKLGDIDFADSNRISHS